VQQLRSKIDRPRPAGGEATRLVAQASCLMGEGRLVCCGATHDDTTGIVGDLHPFVEVEGHGASPYDPGEQMTECGREHGDRTECRVDMKPEVLLRANGRDLSRVIDGTSFDAAAVRTTRNGDKPRARSSAIALRNTAMPIPPAASHGTRRSARAPDSG
jgi:hypothetical protein